jgi:exonuclease SbcD
MRILHTSDWHLGQKFLSEDRIEEHTLALDWLLEQIREHRVDVLVVAGDIFDIGNPPNYARNLYYRFLGKLMHTPCQHAIIVGGNHDSPSMLDAPKEVLHALNVHVVGAARENRADQVIHLKLDGGEEELLVAAVPFLRDRDIREAIPAESGMERLTRIRDGIRMHYQELAAIVTTNYKNFKGPILTTGHLYATGAQVSAKQDNIYLGDIENIGAEAFPDCFDYVALGHIHRAQALGVNHIRYCGSPIPLSFSETLDDKVIVLLTGDQSGITEIQEVPVPTFRRLKTLEGTFEELQKRLPAFAERHEGDSLPAWVELIVQAEVGTATLDQELKELVADANVQILKVRIRRPNSQREQEYEQLELEDMSPEEVFARRCELTGRSEEAIAELKSTFRELQDWWQQQDQE